MWEQMANRSMRKSGSDIYGAVRGNEGSNVTHYAPEESEDKMRLINADALIDNLKSDVAYKDYEWSMYADGFIETIDDAPTIETKEIKYYDEDEQVWKIGKVIVE